MTENKRQAVLICNVAAVMTGAVAWLIPASKEPGVWWFRIGALVVLILATGWYLLAKRRSDLAPDFLAQLSGRFFERDGFAFTVNTEVLSDTCYLCVWFQNRYERTCEATVMVRTSERWLAPQKHLPEAKVSLTCLPGAFGKALVPWFLPVELQGRKVLVDVTATRKYRQGRGKLLRNRVGLAVGSTPVSAVSDILAVLSALFAHPARRAARAQLQLPRGVTSIPMLHLQQQTETVWKLGDPLDLRVEPRVGTARLVPATPA